MPPFAGEAVKVTLVPPQIVSPGSAAILTLAATGALTVMVMLLDVTGEPVAQLEFEIISQVITSPLASEVEE